MNIIKKLSVYLLLVLIFLLFWLWYTSRSVQPEAIKKIITEQIEMLTCQKSTLNGAIVWHLFPTPSIKINDIQIGSQDSLYPNYIIIDHLLFNLQMTPLLRGKVVFNALNIDNFRLTRHRLSAARCNFKSISPSPLQIDKNYPEFAINHILLTNGKIDIIGENPISIKNIQIGANQLNFNNQPFSVQLRSDWSATVAKQELSASINFQGRTTITPSIVNEPVLALKKATIEGQLLVNDLQINDVTINNIKANLNANNQELTLNPLNINLYGGESIGDVKLDYATKAIHFNQTATGINAQALLKNIFNKPILKGKLDFSIHAASLFLSEKWIDSLHAKGNLAITDGLFYNLTIDHPLTPLFEAINEWLQSKLDHDKRAKLNQPNLINYFAGKTKFQLMNIEYQLSDKLLIKDNLLLQTNQLQIKGHGLVNLYNPSLDNHIEIKLLTPSTNSNLLIYLNNCLSFRIYGSLQNPQLSTDENKMASICPHVFANHKLGPSKLLQASELSVYNNYDPITS
ncbi:MAG: AsmA family protein [Legionella sp.]